jgi:hypothetical protein
VYRWVRGARQILVIELVPLRFNQIGHFFYGPEPDEILLVGRALEDIRIHVVFVGSLPDDGDVVVLVEHIERNELNAGDGLGIL